MGAKTVRAATLGFHKCGHTPLHSFTFVQLSGSHGKLY